MIWGSRVRRLALAMCEKDWKNLVERRKLAADGPVALHNYELAVDQKKTDNEQRLWILINKAESYFGLGLMDEYNKALTAAKEIDVNPGLILSFEDQVEKIRTIMHKYGDLINPAWKEN